jgi:hypothetical protein
MYYTINDPMTTWATTELVSGHAKPAWLTEAQDDMELAWQLQQDSAESGDPELAYERLETALNLEKRYRKLYAQWDNAKATLLTDDCTCDESPGRYGSACPVCLAASLIRNGPRGDQP